MIAEQSEGKVANREIECYAGGEEQLASLISMHPFTANQLLRSGFTRGCDSSFAFCVLFYYKNLYSNIV